MGEISKVLQIGSGSMGTRRLRDLSARRDARGDVQLALLEARDDRREAAANRFGINGFATPEEALAWGPDAIVISTPPDAHAPYVELAMQQGLSFFSEADIWTYDYAVVERAVREKGIVAAPSCTFYFLPVVQRLRDVVREDLGKLHAYAMCLSVDAPGWHPGEGAEYYARRRSTAPGREMVPFELIGLGYVFGEPRAVSGTVGRRGELAMDSEDTWCLQMELESGATGQLAVLMASPQTVRKGIAVGSNGIVEFDLAAGTIVRRLPGRGIDDTLPCGTIAERLEATYAAEINTFLDAAQGKREWPFSYRQSGMLTGTLAAAERSAVSGRTEPVDPLKPPALLPDQYR
ncbi:MAG: Gfo/Idh/MocA family oxidoreductase [Paenibacillaceae bacterium]|nr:Gfo/Idh/MocA family oxidoreductase [Paenibacillaceae bacterium]